MMSNITCTMHEGGLTIARRCTGCYGNSFCKMRVMGGYDDHKRNDFVPFRSVCQLYFPWV